MKTLIGNLSLNISLILYLTNYIPQILHNRKGIYLPELSVYFHALLFLSCIMDLFYGFGLSMPWQYKLVSISGVFYLGLQHYQIGKIAKKTLFFQINILLVFIFCIGIFSYLFLTHVKFLFIGFGYLSQSAGFICALPQIVKNIDSTAALSLSVFYLFLDLFSTICDNISAYTLTWPLPSKLGAAFSTAICLLLLYQQMNVKKYERI